MKTGKRRGRPATKPNQATTEQSNEDTKTTPRNNRRQPASNREPLTKIGALWLKKGRDGNWFMSGMVDDGHNEPIKLLVFKNGYKEESRHPDYVIYEVNSADDRGTSDDRIPF